MTAKTHLSGERASLIERLTACLRARPEIVWAYLHGSFLQGGPYRDIDVAGGLDPARGGRNWHRTFSPSPVSTSGSCLVREVNLDRLRELGGHLQDAVRQLRETAHENLGDFELYLTSVGRYFGVGLDGGGPT